MPKFFTQNHQLTERAIYEQKYKTSRLNLLLVVIFTAINLILLVTNSNSYFLFSAFAPYFLTAIGMSACGLFPAEYYADIPGEIIFRDNSYFIILLIISIIITLLYLLAWFKSNKNNTGWLIFSLVFFGIDTLAMVFVGGLSFESILDILFHAWVIYYLVVGVSASNKLKALPLDEEPQFQYENICQNVEMNEENTQHAPSKAPNSFIIREAVSDVKHRVLLEATTNGYNICYRRVKHTNELIVNGNVYDEIQGVIEYPHTLKAFIDGHYIAVGYTGTHSYISFDGTEIAKKLRLY